MQLDNSHKRHTDPMFDMHIQQTTNCKCGCAFDVSWYVVGWDVLTSVHLNSDVVTRYVSNDHEYMVCG